MLFYNFNELDNYIKDNFIENLVQEQENIKKMIDLYSNKKIGLSDIINNIIEKSDFIEKNKSDNFYDTAFLLKKSFEQINEIENKLSELYEDLNYIISLHDKNIQNNINEIKACLVEYNKKIDILFNKILEFENNNSFALNSAIELSFKRINKNFKIKTEDILTIDNKEFNIELEKKDYNTLIISEKDQKAYLPFFYQDIKNIYEKSNNKYQTMQEIISDLYILPLDKFKNSSIARFRESFNLIKNKEKGSIIQALDLGLELMFKYELNPIIIAACRNLDELDIYLDCLEGNELDDFKCFEIKFEIPPKIVKNRKKDTF